MREAARRLGADYTEFRRAYNTRLGTTAVPPAPKLKSVGPKVAAANEVPLKFAVDDWLGGTKFAEAIAEGDFRAASYDKIGGPATKVSQASKDRLLQELTTNGKPATKDLYRGLIVKKGESIEALVKNLGLSSFTPDLGIASMYADTGEFYARRETQRILGTKSVSKVEGVVLQLPKGTLAINIDARGMATWGEKESIVAGRFRVASKTYDARMNATVYKLEVAK